MINSKIAIISESKKLASAVRIKLQDIGLDDAKVFLHNADLLTQLSDFEPALIMLTDGKNPDDLFEQLSNLQPYAYSQLFLPMVVVQCSQNSIDKELLGELGARDFFNLESPSSEFALRLRTLLEARFLHYSLKHANEYLEEKVKKRTQDLEEARLDIVNRLAVATNFRDDITGSHVIRVGHYCKVIAIELGFTLSEAEEFNVAARLHDIGKIAVPDSVLEKPSSLSDEEYSLMKEHTLVGSSILSGSKSKLVQLAEVVARTHHERWDGKGYPDGLAGEDIPLVGRICAVADVYDSLTSQRHYKKAWSVEAALKEIEANSGTQFDPEVVAAFCRVFHREDDPLQVLAAA